MPARYLVRHFVRRRWAASAWCWLGVGTWRFDVIKTGIYYYYLLFLFGVSYGDSKSLFIVELPLP